MQTVSKILVAASLMATALAFPATADEISDAIAKAQTAYNEGKLADAKRELDMATALIAQKNAERLKAFFPSPDGWTATDGQANALPSAVMGGGTTVSRSYSKDDKNLEITLMADSPMMAMVMGMISNPQMAIMSGAKFQNIGTQQVMITQQGEVQAVVANKYFITISGSAPSEDKLAFAGMIDFAGLAAFQ